MPSGRRLLSAHAREVAPLVLGATVISDVGDRRVAVRVTEVEAYGGQGEDPGSHAFRGMTARNAAMFGPPGHAYVYFTYGMHWCFNIVTGTKGVASAVLIRGGEIVDGIDTARERRPTAKTERDLARGPARLSTALGITGECDGIDLLGRSSLVRLVLPKDSVPYVATPRTGVSGPGALTPWRFAADDPSVSPYRASPPSRRRSRLA